MSTLTATLAALPGPAIRTAVVEASYGDGTHLLRAGGDRLRAPAHTAEPIRRGEEVVLARTGGAWVVIARGPAADREPQQVVIHG